MTLQLLEDTSFIETPEFISDSLYARFVDEQLKETNPGKLNQNFEQVGTLEGITRDHFKKDEHGTIFISVDTIGMNSDGLRASTVESAIKDIGSNLKLDPENLCKSAAAMKQVESTVDTIYKQTQVQGKFYLLSTSDPMSSIDNYLIFLSGDLGNELVLEKEGKTTKGGKINQLILDGKPYEIDSGERLYLPLLLPGVVDFKLVGSASLHINSLSNHEVRGKTYSHKYEVDPRIVLI